MSMKYVHFSMVILFVLTFFSRRTFGSSRPLRPWKIDESIDSLLKSQTDLFVQDSEHNLLPNTEINEALSSMIFLNCLVREKDLTPEECLHIVNLSMQTYRHKKYKSMLG